MCSDDDIVDQNYTDDIHTARPHPSALPDGPDATGSNGPQRTSADRNSPPNPFDRHGTVTVLGTRTRPDRQRSAGLGLQANPTGPGDGVKVEHPSRSRLNDLDTDARPAHHHTSAEPRWLQHAHVEQRNIMRSSRCEEMKLVGLSRGFVRCRRRPRRAGLRRGDRGVRGRVEAGFVGSLGLGVAGTTGKRQHRHAGRVGVTLVASHASPRSAVRRSGGRSVVAQPRAV